VKVRGIQRDMKFILYKLQLRSRFVIMYNDFLCEKEKEIRSFSGKIANKIIDN